MLVFSWLVSSSDLMTSFSLVIKNRSFIKTLNSSSPSNTVGNNSSYELLTFSLFFSSFSDCSTALKSLDRVILVLPEVEMGRE